MITLLWIELLLAATLWVAFTFAGRKRKTGARVVRAMFGFLYPGLLFGGLAGISWKFANSSIPHGWLGFTGSLFVAWLIVSIFVARYGLRRGVRTWSPAENWSSRGLFAATAMTLIVLAITLFRIDIAAQTHASAVRASADTMLTALIPPIDPDAANAADVYTRAFAQLHADPDFQPSADSAKIEKDSAEVHALLLRRADTVALLRAASAMPYCRFDHDYSKFDVAMLTPELGDGTRAQRLMQLVVSGELAKGQIAAATNDVTVMFRMSRQIPQVPFVVGGLVRARMDEAAIHALADVLPEIRSTTQLDSIDIGPADFIDVVQPRCLAGEEAMVIGSLSDFLTDSAHRQHRGETDVAFIPPPIGAPFRMYLAWDLDSYCAYMAKVRELANRPWMQTHVGANGPPPPNVPLGCFGSLLRIDPGNIIRAMTIAQARHEAALLAVAIVRYRLDHGRLPNQPGDLAPGEMAALPADPFTGTAMHLAKQKDQWIIYSVGPDGKDDGGKEYDRRTQAGDIGFTLRLAAPAATQPATP